MIHAWRCYIRQVDSSLGILEKDLQALLEKRGCASDEWVRHVDEMIEEISNIIFSIREPRWAEHTDASLVRNLKMRIYEFSARFHEIKTDAFETSLGRGQPRV